MLYNNLHEDEEAVALMSIFLQYPRRLARCWPKRAACKQVIFAIVGDEAEVERLFAIIEQQRDIND